MTKAAGALIKQSFEKRAKRLGLITSSDQSSVISQGQLIEQFYNCEFWSWDLDIDKHRALYKDDKCRCFNCLIHWPRKNDIEHPIYLWQKEIFDALQQNKLIAILKARGIGASEFLLRYAFWLCVKDDHMRGKNMAIITGIREDLSLELLRRFKNLIPDLEWNTRENIADINSCRVIGYPSKRVKDLRGLTDTSLVICDEFAFFDENDKQQILPVLEAFQAKSDAQIVLLSTPGPIGDVFYNLFQEQEDKCRYKRLYIPIQKTLGTLISKQEAEKVRRQGNYEQEFELRFGSYGQGTIFSLADIDFAIKLGSEYYYANPQYNPKAAKYKKYPYIERDAEGYFIGVDPGGMGHSKFGIAMVGLYDNHIHTIVAEEHASPQVDEDEMIKRILYLRNKTPYPKQTKIFIDSANVSFIKRLKSCIVGERTDYQEYIDDLRKRKLIRPPDESQLVHYMDIVPISFSKQGPKLLATLYAFLQRGDIVIHPKFTALISALQSARNVPNRNSNFVLDKTSQSLDCLDAFRLALANLDAGAPEFEPEEEEEAEDDIDNEREEGIVV